VTSVHIFPPYFLRNGPQTDLMVILDLGL